jgi:hypothetical protein
MVPDRFHSWHQNLVKSIFLICVCSIRGNDTLADQIGPAVDVILDLFVNLCRIVENPIDGDGDSMFMEMHCLRSWFSPWPAPEVLL